MSELSSSKSSRQRARFREYTLNSIPEYGHQELEMLAKNTETGFVMKVGENTEKSKCDEIIVFETEEVYQFNCLINGTSEVTKMIEGHLHPQLVKVTSCLVSSVKRWIHLGKVSRAWALKLEEHLTRAQEDSCKVQAPLIAVTTCLENVQNQCGIQLDPQAFVDSKPNWNKWNTDLKKPTVRCNEDLWLDYLKKYFQDVFKFFEEFVQPLFHVVILIARALLRKLKRHDRFKDAVRSSDEGLFEVDKGLNGVGKRLAALIAMLEELNSETWTCSIQ